MKDKTIAIYVFLDDIMIKIKHKEPENRHVNDSEIITTALIAALYFHGNIDHAINFVLCTRQKIYKILIVNNLHNFC